MPSGSLRAWLYLRVSNDPTGRGLSVASQEDELRAWAGRENWQIVGVTTDNDMSASRTARKSRPGYKEVQRAMASGEMDVLACWESSRAQRDLSAYVQTRDLCEKHSVRFAYKGRVYDLSRTDDRFATGLDALLDERYADEVRDRVERGVKTSLKRGSARGKIPFGYRRTYDPGTGAMLNQVPDPATAPIVRELFDRIEAGEGLYTIAADLNRRGVPTPQERRDQRRKVEVDRAGWTSSKIRRQVGNPNIAGYRIHKGQVYGESKWEPLVDAAQFETVRAILADPARRTQNGVEPRYLLSGILECGVCGAKCRRTSTRGRSAYTCHGKNFNNLSCVSIRQEHTDEFVVHAFLTAMASPEVLAEMVEDRSAEVAAASRELATLEAKLAQYRASWLKDSGGISFESFEMAEADLQPRIAEARRRSIPSWIPSGVLELATGDTHAVWAGMTLVERRAVLSTMLEVIVRKPTRPTGSHGFDHTRLSVRMRQTG